MTSTPSRQNSYSAFDSPMLRYGSFTYDGGVSPFISSTSPTSLAKLTASSPEKVTLYSSPSLRSKSSPCG
jgi:hypothetical protein